MVIKLISFTYIGMNAYKTVSSPRFYPESQHFDNFAFQICQINVWKTRGINVIDPDHFRDSSYSLTSEPLHNLVKFL